MDHYTWSLPCFHRWCSTCRHRGSPQACRNRRIYLPAGSQIAARSHLKCMAERRRTINFVLSIQVERHYLQRRLPHPFNLQGRVQQKQPFIACARHGRGGSGRHQNCGSHWSSCDRKPTPKNPIGCVKLREQGGGQHNNKPHHIVSPTLATHHRIAWM